MPAKRPRALRKDSLTSKLARAQLVFTMPAPSKLVVRFAALIKHALTLPGAGGAGYAYKSLNNPRAAVGGSLCALLGPKCELFSRKDKIKIQPAKISCTFKAMKQMQAFEIFNQLSIPHMHAGDYLPKDTTGWGTTL
eukprot:1141385-Pelagomonas_calceolata.AAC.2